MNVGSLTMNDSTANFFKAVETARQRNVSAFESTRPAAASGAPVRSAPRSAAPATSQHRFYRTEMTGVNTAPGASPQTSGLQKTRILGNFFDAYA
jgi:hypothetical protein